MDSKVDMSLDDIIRTEGIGRKPFNRNRQNNRFNGNRNFPNNRKFGNRNYQNNRNNFMNRNQWNGAPRNFHYQPALLHISNLAPNVTSEDLNELFSTFGNLNRSFVHYDQFGKSIGTADVEFERRNEAIQARNKLNNVPLDGKELKISMIPISNDDDFTMSFKSLTNRRGSNMKDRRRNGFNNGRKFNNNRQLTGNNFKNNRSQNLTADDLDREMDEWREKLQENDISNNVTETSFEAMDE